MLTRALLLALVLPASLVLGPGCGALFPEREATGQSNGTGNGTGNDNTGGTTGTDHTPPSGAGLGFMCDPGGDAPCEHPAAECVANGGSAGINTCLVACETQDDCPGGSRCTNSPEGRYCLRQCSQSSDCAGIHLNLVCIPTSTESVCWPKDNQGGELIAVADPVVASLDLRRCAAPNQDCGQAGLPQPGTAASLTIQVRNEGALDVENASVTLVAQSAAVSQLTGATSKLGVLAAGGGAGALSASFAIAPTATAGEALPFTLRVVGDGPGAEWNLPISLQLYTTTATLYVTETELTRAGQPVNDAAVNATTQLALRAQNLGFEAAAQVTAAVTVSAPGATWVPTGGSAQPFPQMTNSVPLPAKLISEGTLTLDPGFSGAEIDLEVVLTDVSGATWSQTITLPVAP